ncbi:MAG: flagellar M-ring protein FliF C-terminal domain-containing protein [Anaerocolumna sp.]
MVERLKQIPVQLLDQWNKYTSKQKTIIIGVIVTVFLALFILVNIMNRTIYKTLIISESSRDASTVASLLKEENIPYQLAEDNLTIKVDEKRYSDAILLVYSSDVSTSGLTLDELVSNDLSTTNSDRNLKNHLYVQTEIRNYLIKMNGIKDASVTYVPQDTTYSVLTERQDYPASVALTITDSFELSTAAAVAEYVAAAIGNETTEKIKIIDQNGNLLFGGEEDLYSGNATSVLEYREKLQNTYNNNIYMLMMKLGYDEVQPMFNWALNMDKVTELYTEQIPAEGSDQGLYKNYYSYEAENSSATSGGTPGTDSNDETSYYVEDGSSEGSTVTTTQIEYLPSERVTNTEYEVGAVIPEESSGSIVVTKVVTFTKSQLEAQGLLEDMTYDEYQVANNDPQQVEVGEDVYNMVSMATGIAVDRISIIAYEQPVYLPTADSSLDWTFYLQILLAVAIVGLLIYVVFRGTSPVEVTELEPELSVEQLLATTKENQTLDDIEFSEKSEAKKMIEKFVDENPEAVAQLLRNWLNDEWG